MRSHAHPWFSDGSEPATLSAALRLCPEHCIEDTCYAEALQRAWAHLKARHADRCTRTDCQVDDAHVTITHGNASVTANVEFFWREKVWAA